MLDKVVDFDETSMVMYDFLKIQARYGVQLHV